MKHILRLMNRIGHAWLQLLMAANHLFSCNQHDEGILPRWKTVKLSPRVINTAQKYLALTIKCCDKSG